MSPVSQNWSKLLLVVTPAMFFSLVSYAGNPSKAVKGKAKAKVKAGQPENENNDIKNETERSSDKLANKTDSQVKGSKSRDIRNSQTANIDILYTPVSDFVLSFGGGGSYNAKPDLALGLHYLTGSKTTHYDSTGNGVTVKGDATIHGSAGYVYGRYFFGNSFNMMAGLGVRTGPSENWCLS